MTEKLNIILIPFLFFCFQCSSLACGCRISPASFCGGISETTAHVALVKSLNYGFYPYFDPFGKLVYAEYTEVLVLEELKGELNADTLQIAGDDGASCQANFFRPDGDTVLLNITQDGILGDTVVQTLPGCLISLVDLKNDTLIGQVAHQVEKIAYTDFKQEFNSCVAAIPDYGLKIYLYKEGSKHTDSTLRNFSITINDQVYQANTFPWFSWSFHSPTDQFVQNMNFFKQGESLRGLSTNDLILLRKHILGIEELNSPLKRLAADVSQNGKISTLDLIQLQRLILGKRTQFVNNRDWILIPGGFRFDHPNEPWKDQIPTSFEVRSDKNIRESYLNLRVVKIGDLDHSF